MTAPDLTKFEPYAEALYHALRPDPFYLGLEVRVADGLNAKQAMLAYHSFSIFEAGHFGRIVMSDPEALGASVWACPLPSDQASRKARAKKQYISEKMGQACLSFYTEVGNFMGHMSAPITDENDWYLSILGLAPECQGRGIGRGLVSPILDEADRAGVATYLETFTPGNMRFYEQLGYVAMGQFEEPMTASPYWLMRREPVQGGRHK